MADNSFYNLATKGSLSNASAAADLTGSLARSGNSTSSLSTKSSSGASILNSDGTITQTERLLSARARYGKTNLLTGSSGDLGGSRGQWAYIKLMTTTSQYKDYVNGSNNRQVTWASDLIGQGSIVAKMSDPGNDMSKSGYDKFLITGVSCQMSEKMQIQEVFGDHEVVYYFGRQPLIFNLTGMLIDSPDNNWFITWIKLYSEFLRGTQLAKNYELLKIVLPNMAITGSITSFTWNQSSDRDVDIPFSLQFVAKVVEPLPATSDGMITSNKLAYVDFSQIASFTGIKQINSYKAQLQAATATIQNPSATLYDKASALGQIGTTTGGAFGQWLSDSKDTLTGYQATIDGWDKARADYVTGIKTSAAYQSVTSALAGIRLNLISPIYGIMSSLMKLVSNTANSAVSLLNGIVSPIRNILRDITNISKQAVALVNLVNSSIRGVGRAITGSINGIETDFKTAVQSLGKAAGAIATAPITVSQSVAGMFSNSGVTLNAPFLTYTSKLSYVKPVLSGLAPTSPPSRAELLVNITKYSPQKNTL